MAAVTPKDPVFVLSAILTNEVSAKMEKSENPLSDETTKANEPGKKQAERSKVSNEDGERIIAEFFDDELHEFFDDFMSGFDVVDTLEGRTDQSRKISAGTRSNEGECKNPLRSVEISMKSTSRKNAKLIDQCDPNLYLKLQTKNNRKGFLEKSIYVRCCPPAKTISDIALFFSKFGVVERCTLETDFAIVEFKKKWMVKSLLRRPPLMDGQQLEITRMQWKKHQLVPYQVQHPRNIEPQKQPSKILKTQLAPQRTSENSENLQKHKLDIKGQRRNNIPPVPKQVKKDPVKSASEISFKELKTKLKSQTTFEEELSIFLEMIELTEDEVEKKWESIHSSLLEALQASFPKCEINRFGSTVTGLCFKGSDIDIYLNIGETINQDEDQNIDWTPITILEKVNSLLRKRKRNFWKVIPIRKAKTPIVKFVHFPTFTNCDISFKNGLGVMNSQLIKRLLSLDIRLKPLMMIIKFWAKTYGLSCPGKFSNYTISMMIIFYLQQPETRLLPTIEELQKNCEPVYQWNWQVNFDRNSKFPPSKNENSIAELLAGFFKFYEKFPFNEKLIRPLVGLAHPRADFVQMCVEQGKGADYLNIERPICLQDPIRLNENLTDSVSLKILEKFQILCAIGAQICDAARDNKAKRLLLNLITISPVLWEDQNITISSEKTLEAGLPADFLAKTDIENRKEFIENHWYTLTQKLFEDVLTKVIKMDIQMTKSDCGGKEKNIVEPSDIHSQYNNEIVLECMGNYYMEYSGKLYHDLKEGRIKGFWIDATLNNIDKQALIFDELVKQQKQMGLKPTKIDCTCTILRERNPVRLVIKFKDRNSTGKSFKHFKHYVNTRLLKIMNKELLHIQEGREKGNQKVL